MAMISDVQKGAHQRPSFFKQTAGQAGGFVLYDLVCSYFFANLMTFHESLFKTDFAVPSSIIVFPPL